MLSIHRLPSLRGDPCTTGASSSASALDRAALYLLIAALYSLFAIPVKGDDTAWLVLASAWALAALGVIATLLDLIRRPVWIVVSYVAMGWLVVIGIVHLEPMAQMNIGLLLIGGLAYTASAIVFIMDGRMRFGQPIWHALIIVGSSLHLASVMA